MSPAARIAAALVAAYRRFLSPWKPACCRFHPTCSQYALEAFRAHGFVRGLGLAVWRVLRCQPFARGGWDPVPEPRKPGAGADAASRDAHR